MATLPSEAASQSSRSDANSHVLTVERLPNDALNEQWRQLHFADDLKERLVRYLDIEAWLTERQIPMRRLAARRALLLVGPPGCGKTTLAQALPNHWASRRNRRAVLISVNGHTLRSSKLGQTERNIQDLFRHIREAAATQLATFVVIDEIESVAVDRASVNTETNPLDVMFGVNAFIEGLDTLLELSNVSWIFTSNLPVLIERAVEERADFHVFVPLPDGEQRANILADALDAIALGCPRMAAELRDLASQPAFFDLIRLSEGLSARQLRQLVLHALTLVERPEDLELAHVVSAARIARLRQRHLVETGGVYSHPYQRRASPNQDEAPFRPGTPAGPPQPTSEPMPTLYPSSPPPAIVSEPNHEREEMGMQATDALATTDTSTLAVLTMERTVAGPPQRSADSTWTTIVDFFTTALEARAYGECTSFRAKLEALRPVGRYLLVTHGLEAGWVECDMGDVLLKLHVTYGGAAADDLAPPPFDVLDPLPGPIAPAVRFHVAPLELDPFLEQTLRSVRETGVTIDIVHIIHEETVDGYHN